MRYSETIQRAGRRGAALLCAALLCVSLLEPLLSVRAAAADSTFQNAMDHLSAWNVMRGYADGDFRPNNPITRAEFVAMVNRAYGYTETGPTPFLDVPAGAWYADDIAIGFNTGYFTGTTKTTASPRSYLSREQAMVLLARSMRLESIPGQVTEFADGNAFASFSRGYVKAAVGQGLMSGYPDGTFRPKSRITRGAMAQLLYNALGTLVSQPGEHALGGVFGNLTINCSNVTLRDTTIAGNLYISGGVGLGGVTLENVRVLGQIIVAGSGESELGENSVVLRNVEAEGLRVDTLGGQGVSLSAEGNTLIEKTVVRTDAYIQDRTRSDYGLLNISLEGAAGASFGLAGNLKNVVNRTPESTLNFAQGTVQNLTVDEKATGSKLSLGTNAVAKTLNLDVGVPVTGQGDVETLNVNANGASTTMLPDKIVIRPDVTANIAGERMDSATAQESSADPRLLSGYPKAKDVAPASLSADFSGNKSGTVYWAISSVTDGSVEEDELISPSAYGSIALKSGNTKLTASSTPATSKVTGLTPGGSYYLSAVLVDARDARSPVKVTSFTTPDDTVPNFAAGYPYMSQITDTSAQTVVMSTKSCRLYYALLPKGSTAPKAADFKAAAVTGNWGYGSVDLIKNDPQTINVNDKVLVELETYDLYLWLTDVDGAKSSAVKKITFTTVDKTAPVFQTQLMVNSVKATSLGLTGVLNETGTVYWALVKQGTKYPTPAAGQEYPPADSAQMADYLKSEYARLQVANGINALKAGKVSAKENTNFTINITGLEAETYYDIYYVATDAAGNYTESVYKLGTNTLDNIAPTATQEFTRYSGSNKAAPYANTDVRIIFSENVQRASKPGLLLDLYTKVKESPTDAAREALREALSSTIKLYNATGSNMPTLVKERTSDADTDWVIDYRNAKVELTQEGKLVVTFPTTADAPQKDSALRLNSGSTYYFQLEDLADTSSAKNLMGVTALDRFTTISAQAALAPINVTSLGLFTSGDDAAEKDAVDMAFSLTPLSTSKVEGSIDWDMLLWSDTSVSFTLYERTRTKTTTGETVTDWKAVNADGGAAAKEVSITTSNSTFVGQSLGSNFKNLTAFPPLRTSLDENTVYEYAIHFTKVDGLQNRSTWSQRVNFRVSVMAGTSVELGNLAADVTDQNYQDALAAGVADIGTPENFSLRKQFVDTDAPTFATKYPQFQKGDTWVDMTVLLNRPGTIYYVVAPVGRVTAQTSSGDSAHDVTFAEVPKGGSDSTAMPTLTTPGYLDIVSNKYSNSEIKTGSISVGTGAVPIRVDGLKPETEYFVFYVLKGTGQVYSSVNIFGFKTEEVSRPVITLRLSNPTVYLTSNMTAEVNYILIPYTAGIMDSLLTATFRSVVQDPKVFDAGGIYADTTYGAATFTVLNAMATSSQNMDGSLYDELAKQTKKDELARFIRAAEPSAVGGILGTSGSTPVEVAANRSLAVDCSQWAMEAGTPYAFLAVGRSPMGSGDAFSAIYTVSLPQTNPPLVTSVNTYSLKADPTTGQVTGTFTLNFNMELCYSKPSSSGLATRYHLDQAPVMYKPATGTSDPTKRDENYMSLESTKDRSSGVTLSLANSNVNRPTYSITFNVFTNGYYYFQPRLCNENGQIRDAALTIDVYSEKDENGVYQPKVSVSPQWYPSGT